MDGLEPDSEAIVGEACHIVAEKLNGPRGVSTLSEKQRNSYTNLILLCNVHHKQIDDQTADFTVERLHTTKSEHEQWVRSTLALDVPRQEAEELYAEYLEEWTTRIRLNEWTGWTSWLLSGGQPSLGNEMKVALDDVSPWILSRIWPGQHPQLEASFRNFMVVARDLVNVFGTYAVQVSDDLWRTEKFYKLKEWDPEGYRVKSEEYDAHVDLVQDLTLELTRAANLLCDRVREVLFARFRIRQGALLIQSGPHRGLSVVTSRVEYQTDERTAMPYPGLKEFKSVRLNRDSHFGGPPRPDEESGDRG